MAEGYKEDAQVVPDPGLDAGRIKPFGWDGAPPADEGFKHNFQGDTAPSSLPGEPGHNTMTPYTGENDFPRQTGHDSLSENDALLS